MLHRSASITSGWSVSGEYVLYCDESISAVAGLSSCPFSVQFRLKSACLHVEQHCPRLFPKVHGFSVACEGESR